ncbi:hypothetical protein [Winogradskyella sp.]|jgi:hypothetical protein|uniref:hypothetical protein n=1 Tax=Winogradskyella sp. TaxID=1883156 RepID=UPI0025E088FD|nr:hypothetical protein [Winogradskyella sp.]MCT4628726.1 hypothetical protein [Winogradskyella sp.]
MTLKSAPIEKEKKSKFYLEFESITNEIVNFSNKFKLDLKEDFNSYFLNFEINGSYENSEIKIKGERKLINVSSGFIPKDSVYQEIIDFKTKTSIQSFNKIRLERKNLFRLLSNKFTNKKSIKINDRFQIVSKNKNLLNKVVKITPELEKLIDYKLNKLEFNENGFMNLRFLKMIRTEKDWDELLLTIFKIKRQVR